MPFCYNYHLTLGHFYENNVIDIKEDLNNINEEIINKLKEKAIILNKICNNPNFTRIEKYCKKIERIETASKTENDFNKISTNNSIEKLLLFMFSVDPNLEAFIIYSACNNVKEIKYAMNKEFGLYDPYLIKVERIFVRYLLNQKDKEKLNEEIGKRVFK